MEGGGGNRYEDIVTVQNLTRSSKTHWNASRVLNYANFPCLSSKFGFDLRWSPILFGGCHSNEWQLRHHGLLRNEKVSNHSMFKSGKRATDLKEGCFGLIVPWVVYRTRQKE